MEGVWRFRIMLLTAFALIMFGDYFGYANIRTTASKNPTTLRDAQPELDIEEGKYSRRSIVFLNLLIKRISI